MTCFSQWSVNRSGMYHFQVKVFKRQCVYISHFSCFGNCGKLCRDGDSTSPSSWVSTMRRAPGQHTEINFSFVKPLRVEDYLLQSHNLACFDLCTLDLGNEAFPAFSHPRRSYSKLGPNYDLWNTSICGMYWRAPRADNIPCNSYGSQRDLPSSLLVACGLPHQNCLD